MAQINFLDLSKFLTKEEQNQTIAEFIADTNSTLAIGKKIKNMPTDTKLLIVGNNEYLFGSLINVRIEKFAIDVIVDGYNINMTENTICQYINVAKSYTVNDTIIVYVLSDYTFSVVQKRIIKYFDLKYSVQKFCTDIFTNSVSKDIFYPISQVPTRKEFFTCNLSDLICKKLTDNTISDLIDKLERERKHQKTMRSLALKIDKSYIGKILILEDGILIPHYFDKKQDRIIATYFKYNYCLTFSQKIDYQPYNRKAKCVVLEKNDETKDYIDKIFLLCKEFEHIQIDIEKLPLNEKSI